MTTRRLRRPPTSKLRAYGIAAGAVAAAFVVRDLLVPLLGAQSTMLLFVLPVVVAIVFGGVGPALFAAVAGAALGTLRFLRPAEAALAPASATTRLVLFFAEALAIILIVDRVRRSEDREQLAEAQRHRSASLLDAIVDSSPHAIVALEDDRVRAWNAAAERTFGWSADEVLGKPLPIVPDDVIAEMAELQRRARAGETVAARVTLRTRDQRLLRCDASLAPLHDAHGPITGVLATLTDVSERVRLEEQLRQAQKMEAVGQLASGIAHDFNNHLTAVLGFAEVLDAQLAADHPGHADLEQILEAGRSAAALTRRLLDFGRKQVLELVPVDVAHVVESSALLLRRAVREDVEISIRTGASPSWVLADRAQLEHILLNLVLNARDAMPGGGVVAIETAVVEVDPAALGEPLAITAGPHVVVAVRDSGHGMSPDVRRRIFEPFFTTKRAGNGSGLGLPMVYSAVGQMGGAIEVESAEGRGSTFRIYLPLLPTPAEQDAQAALDAPDGNGERVLVVDDNPVVRSLAAAALRRAGYLVVDADGPQRAVAIAERERFELLVTDVAMPGGSGPELAARLLAEGRVRRVLFTSGYAEEGMRATAAATEGSPFLGKPFTPSDLQRAVRQALEEGPAQAATAPAITDAIDL